MNRFKISGVPEHFNYPWHYAAEQGYFKKENIEIQWQDNKSGTGSIVQSLNSGEVDVAVVLTEGMIANIAKGNQSKIIQVFVKSALRWGIHVSNSSSIQHKYGIEGKRFAISRFGSGSHIMAYVLANQLGYTINKEDFVLVNDMEGAIQALNKGEAEVFLWEKFMTMPWVESGKLKRIGELPTPWPGFVIAANQDTINHRFTDVNRMLRAIRTASGDFMANADIEPLAKRYGLKIDKMYEWFQITEWETRGQISADMIYTTAQVLHEVGVIDEVIKPEHCCAPWVSLT